MVGQKFNRLLCLKYAYTKKDCAYWLFRCDCGTEKIIWGHYVRSGHIKSCGCLWKESIIKSNKITKTTHGMSYSNFYATWFAMVDRCINKDHQAYPSYGGRGIKVCERWRKFENFRDDMYESYLAHIKEFGEKNTSIDRFPNVNGNYEPNNCKWSTKLEQSNHRRCVSKTKNHIEHVRMRSRVGAMITDIMHNDRKKSKHTKYLGCTIPFFRQHIESQFESWMNWDNYGPYRKKSKRAWNVDHIIPVWKFDLSKEEDVYKCFHYTNLRPYDSKHNDVNKHTDQYTE
jgi:hypothetical protein